MESLEVERLRIILYSNTKLGKLTIQVEQPIEKMDWCIPIRCTFSAVNRTLISRQSSATCVNKGKRRPTTAVKNTKTENPLNYSPVAKLIPRFSTNYLASNAIFWVKSPVRLPCQRLFPDPATLLIVQYNVFMDIFCLDFTVKPRHASCGVVGAKLLPPANDVILNSQSIFGVTSEVVSR